MNEQAVQRARENLERYNQQVADVKRNMDVGNWKEAKRELDDLGRKNRLRMAELMESTDDPETLMRIAVADSILTEEEAHRIVRAHNAMSKRADNALQMWLRKHGSPINLISGDELHVIQEYEKEKQALKELNVVDYGPLFNMFSEIREWISNPRRRQKLIWLAIVTPAVVACLIELL